MNSQHHQTPNSPAAAEDSRAQAYVPVDPTLLADLHNDPQEPRPMGDAVAETPSATTEDAEQAGLSGPPLAGESNPAPAPEFEPCNCLHCPRHGPILRGPNPPVAPPLPPSASGPYQYRYGDNDQAASDQNPWSAGAPPPPPQNNTGWAQPSYTTYPAPEQLSYDDVPLAHPAAAATPAPYHAPPLPVFPALATVAAAEPSTAMANPAPRPSQARPRVAGPPRAKLFADIDRRPDADGKWTCPVCGTKVNGRPGSISSHLTTQHNPNSAYQKSKREKEEKEKKEKNGE